MKSSSCDVSCPHQQPTFLIFIHTDHTNDAMQCKVISGIANKATALLRFALSLNTSRLGSEIVKPFFPN